MKTAFLGYGGMGRAMASAAKNRSHDIVATIDAGEAWEFNEADVVFEASVPHVCIDNIKKLCTRDDIQNIVVATTGWYDRLDEVKKVVEDSDKTLLWSSNFSIGVNVYYRIVEAASKLINKAEEFDIWGTEIHHHNKVDSPSGTAKILENILLENIDRKTSVVEETLQRKIEPDEIHFTATRGGAINFGHTIGFDSAADCIKIEHAARSRDGYALGAVKTAEWLVQQTPGFYSMEDFLVGIFGK